MTAKDAAKALQKLASPEVAATSARFFKTGPGEYGEGDQFIGVRVPAVRKVAREFKDLSFLELEILLKSPMHEERLLALLILVLRVDRATTEQRQEIFEFYMANRGQVNNWDLVDSSAPAIVGGYYRDRSRKPLQKLARSSSLWERRIAIIATQHFIRLNDHADTLALCRLLLQDKEDLIHKATGWMLREVGARDRAALEGFLQEHAAVMPRTMLRYAIEHLTSEERQSYLALGRRDRKANEAS